MLIRLAIIFTVCATVMLCFVNRPVSVMFSVLGISFAVGSILTRQKLP